MTGLPPFRFDNEEPSASDMLTEGEFERIPDCPRVNLKVSAWRDENGDSSSRPVLVGERSRRVKRTT